MTHQNRSKNRKAAENIRFARSIIGITLSPTLIEQLRELTKNFALSLRLGDLLFLSGGWYVTHSGLIRLAARQRCRRIHVQPIAEFSDSKNGRYVFKATVYKSRTCQGFVGYGDADSSNVSLLVHGAHRRKPPEKLRDLCVCKPIERIPRSRPRGRTTEAMAAPTPPGGRHWPPAIERGARLTNSSTGDPPL